MEDPLTSLSPPLEYSLEFPYCFWTQNQEKVNNDSPESDRASDSGGPSLPFDQNCQSEKSAELSSQEPQGEAFSDQKGKVNFLELHF